ncbi:MAG: hypothetical protein V1882_07485 [Candidatus Omnitrophota bacterium]
MNKPLFLLFMIFIVCPHLGSADSGASKTQPNQYQKAVNAQSQYHALRTQGNRLLNEGRYPESLICHEKAFKMAEGTSLEAVSRNKLMILYEKLGSYSKALGQCQWFLTRSNGDSPLWDDWVKTKQRLLRKIEAQKRGEKIAEPKPASSGTKAIRNVVDFETASYADQKEYLEKKFPENTEILKLSKQALLAEHAGKFAEAKEYYEQLLSRKEDVTATQGEGAWPMLHCAVQRTSELTGDEAREKEMLGWIKANMLDPQGQFHQSLSNLMLDVIDHLNKQIKKYQL